MRSTASPTNTAQAHPHRDLQIRLRRLSWLMDNAIRLPTGHRMGIDGLIGLVPGVGDVLGAVVASYFIFCAARLHVPKSVLARMVLNVSADTVLGAIPGLGDLFDLGFKANTRNYALLESYLDEPRSTRIRTGILLAMTAVALCASLTVTIVIVGALLAAVYHRLFG